MHTVAFGIWSLEKLIDIFKSEVEDTITANQYGQLPWYQTVSKSFQLGDQLVFNGQYFEYEEIDTDKQIVTQSAATVDDTGTIIMKVAKGELPNIVPLDLSEYQAFVYYMKGSNSPAANDGIAPAGTKISVVSSESDELKFAIDLFYNPLIISSDGSSVGDPSEFPVEDAVNDFINTLPFDSVFKVIDLINAVQAVNGVDNVVVKNCDARKAGDPAYTDVLSETGQKYTTFAGYLRMDSAHPLDGEYTAGVPTIDYISE